MQSYNLAKAHRRKKIKSKKFHRIQRKERIKKTLKEFEELQKTDPEAALEKLEQLDRARAEERMTLRHKSTGQWAKSKQVRAKYDKEVKFKRTKLLKNPILIKRFKCFFMIVESTSISGTIVDQQRIDPKSKKKR